MKVRLFLRKKTQKYVDNNYSYHKYRPNHSPEVKKYLISWFYTNITNPYPDDETKNIFSQATGLSIIQISYFFTNQRKRNKIYKEYKNNETNY